MTNYNNLELNKIDNLKKNFLEKLDKCLSNKSNYNNLKSLLDKCLSNESFYKYF